MKLFSLTFCLILCGCSIAMPKIEQPLSRVVRMRMLGGSAGCKESYQKAVDFYSMHGIKIVDAPDGYSLHCYPPVPFITRSLVWLLNFGLVNIDGRAEVGGPIGMYTAYNNQPEYSAKLAIHEIGHILKLDHTVLGVMTFDNNLIYFATGFSNSTIKGLHEKNR